MTTLLKTSSRVGDEGQRTLSVDYDGEGGYVGSYSFGATRLVWFHHTSDPGAVKLVEWVDSGDTLFVMWSWEIEGVGGVTVTGERGGGDREPTLSIEGGGK